MNFMQLAYLLFWVIVVVVCFRKWPLNTLLAICFTMTALGTIAAFWS